MSAQPISYPFPCVRKSIRKTYSIRNDTSKHDCNKRSLPSTRKDPPLALVELRVYGSIRRHATIIGRPVLWRRRRSWQRVGVSVRRRSGLIGARVVQLVVCEVRQSAVRYRVVEGSDGHVGKFVREGLPQKSSRRLVVRILCGLKMFTKMADGVDGGQRAAEAGVVARARPASSVVERPRESEPPSASQQLPPHLGKWSSQPGPSNERRTLDFLSSWLSCVVVRRDTQLLIQLLLVRLHDPKTGALVIRSLLPIPTGLPPCLSIQPSYCPFSPPLCASLPSPNVFITFCSSLHVSHMLS